MTGEPNFYVDIDSRRLEVTGETLAVRAKNGELAVEFDGASYRVSTCVLIWLPDTLIPGKGWVSELAGVKDPPTYLPANYECVYEAHDLPDEYEGMIERGTAQTRWISHTYTIIHGADND